MQQQGETCDGVDGGRVAAEVETEEAVLVGLAQGVFGDLVVVRHLSGIGGCCVSCGEVVLVLEELVADGLGMQGIAESRCGRGRRRRRRKKVGGRG